MPPDSSLLRSPEASQAATVLRRRARELAAPAATLPDDGRERQILCFGLAREEYGIDVAWVREARQGTDWTPMPSAPPHVVGATSVRGRVVSLVDIKRFLGLPDLGLADIVLVLSEPRMEFGILVDAVAGVRAVPESRIRPIPPNLNGIRQEFLDGVTDEGLILLHGSRLLGAPELRIGGTRSRGPSPGAERSRT